MEVRLSNYSIHHALVIINAIDVHVITAKLTNKVIFTVQ